MKNNKGYKTAKMAEEKRQVIVNFSWRDSVRNLTDFRLANLVFLQGDIDWSVFHGAPVDKETIPLLGDLRMIQKLGMITTEGQPADCIRELNNLKDGLIWEHRQRPYLLAIYPKTKADNFAKEMDMWSKSPKLAGNQKLYGLENFG